MALFIPEVFADAVNAKLENSIRIGRIAFDATGSVGEIKNAGDTIHFPRLNRVVTATEIQKGTPLNPATISMDDTSAKIKWVGAPARVFKDETHQIKGAVMDDMVQQTADAMALAIDGDLVVAMDTDAVFKEATAAADAITAAELMAAIGCFGDDIDTDSFAGIIINSRLYKSFVGMDEFVSTAKTYQTEGNGIVTDGVVGYFVGIPVIVCNNKTFDAETGECKTYIVKKRALGYVFQQDITVDEDFDVLLQCYDIVASSLYACKLLDANGVVILRKTIA